MILNSERTPSVSYQEVIEAKINASLFLCKSLFCPAPFNLDFSLPRKGKNNDKAHPPIHPTSPGSDLSGTDRSVFEFIARRFLACCSLNAEGRETVVTAAVGREEFECRGVCIVARNYLDVYPYDRWSENEVAPYQRNQQLPFQSFLLQQGTPSG